LDAILEFKSISKSFSGVKVLDDINLAIAKGEVHALCGENGAGKSTLVKILSGVYEPDNDGGKLFVENEQVRIFTPIHARQIGISIIYQELDLIPFLTVKQNITLSNEPKTRTGLFIDEKKASETAKELFDRLEVSIPLNARVMDLSVAKQQMVMIAKAVSHDTKILIMDEPSASLADEDVKHMFDMVRTLQRQGISIIYISHRLEEIFEIADRFTVLRDGKQIVTDSVAGTNKESLIKYMIGRELKDNKRESKAAARSVKVLEVKDLYNETLKGASLDLYEGEILGVSGLVGSGRSELARAIFGADPIDSGEIILHGRKITRQKTENAIEKKIAFMPEDRKTQGLLMNMSVRNNSTLAGLKKRFSKRGFINNRAEKSTLNDMIAKLNIRPANQDMMVKRMSGGNQQKVVLAKWLLTDSSVLIMDEPTRGIDVGAKDEIYNLMYEMKEQGVSIIMISSELPEILKMSDRVVVMSRGMVTGVLTGDEADEISEINIMKLAHE